MLSINNSYCGGCMNIRDLTYLVRVAELGHFGRAAEACFVSQPALSMQIKKLEQELGVQLFERSNKSVTLTDIGITIVALARQLLQQVDQLYDVAQAAKDPFKGEIKLGIFPTLGPYLLPFIMPELSHSLPNVSFYLVEEKTHLLIEKIKAGVIDAAILSLPLLENGLCTSFLFEEEFLLAVAHTHPLAKQLTIKKEAIDHQTLLLLDDGHCMKDQVNGFCRGIEASITSSFRATSLEVLRHMVSSGVGITLMPKLSTRRCSLNGYIPFDEPKPSRSIALVYRTSTPKQQLLDAIEEIIKKQVG